MVKEYDELERLVDKPEVFSCSPTPCILADDWTIDELTDENGWTPCLNELEEEVDCGGGTKTRTKEIVQQPYGTECPDNMEIEECAEGSCNTPPVVSDACILPNDDPDDTIFLKCGGYHLYATDPQFGLVVWSPNDDGSLTYKERDCWGCSYPPADTTNFSPKQYIKDRLNDEQWGLGLKNYPYPVGVWADDRFVYVIRSHGPTMIGHLLIYGIDERGKLVRVHSSKLPTGCVPVKIWGDGRFIYISSNQQGYGTLFILLVNDNGTYEHVNTFSGHKDWPFYDGERLLAWVGYYRIKENIRGIWSDDKFVYLACSRVITGSQGSHLTMTYVIEVSNTGQITYRDKVMPPQCTNGWHPKLANIWGDGRFIYITSDGCTTGTGLTNPTPNSGWGVHHDAAILVYSVDSVGKLTHRFTTSVESNGNEARVSGNGKYVYFTCGSMIYVYEVQTDGSLVLRDVETHSYAENYIKAGRANPDEGIDMNVLPPLYNKLREDHAKVGEDWPHRWDADSPSMIASQGLSNFAGTSILMSAGPSVSGEFIWSFQVNTHAILSWKVFESTENEGQITLRHVANLSRDMHPLNGTYGLATDAFAWRIGCVEVPPKLSILTVPSANYTYFDANGDPEDGSEIRWYKVPGEFKAIKTESNQGTIFLSADGSLWGLGWFNFLNAGTSGWPTQADVSLEDPKHNFYHAGIASFNIILEMK